MFSWTIINHQVPPAFHRAAGGQKILRRLRRHARSAGHQTQGENYEGAPAYQLYIAAADELDYHLQHNPSPEDQRRISAASFEP